MIANIKLYPRSQLPNSNGFRFLGYSADGQKYRCEVVKGADGMHRIEGMNFADLVGWTNCVGGEE